MFYFNEYKKANVVTAAEQGLQSFSPESDTGREALHRLDYETWLPYAAKLYEISPNIEDYHLVSVPICPADIPNRNGIGFPLQELVKFQEPPISRMAYKAWTGSPLHYEHANEIHKDAYGVVLDSALHKVNGYGRGKMWKVMGLAAVDKTKYKEMARRVAAGDINTYSMGALVDSFTCSHCGEPMTDKYHCVHLNPDNDIDWREVRGLDLPSLAFRNSHGINPIELSIVESPAWTTALSDHILTR